MSTATDDRARGTRTRPGAGHRPCRVPSRTRWPTTTCCSPARACCSRWGAIMVLSSSSAYAAANMNDSYYFFTRQVAFLIAGVLARGWLARRSEDFFKLFGLGGAHRIHVRPVPGAPHTTRNSSLGHQLQGQPQLALPRSVEHAARRVRKARAYRVGRRDPRHPGHHHPRAEAALRALPGGLLGASCSAWSWPGATWAPP